MALSLDTRRLGRYREIALLLWKYGRSDLVRSAGLEDALREEPLPDDGHPAAADELAADLERLGPTFVKLGQLLSTRGDLLPPAFLMALSRLQDHVEPVPYDQIAEVVRSELKTSLSVAFPTFEPTPLASASLGQVHRATLPNGAPVAVKIQRPAIREQIAQDLDILAHVADFLEKHMESARRIGVRGMLDEFRRSLVDELDYTREAGNLVILGRNLAEFERLVVPAPVASHTTARVLTMDYIRGRKVTPLEMLGRREADGEALADEVFRAYLKQVLVDGFFHADPHPGNIFLTDDGRIALLDLGMVARVAPELQDKLLRWLLAVSEGRAEDATELALRIGEKLEHFDEADFRRRIGDLIARHRDADVSQMEVGRLVLDTTRISAECGVRVPRELTMLGKALLNLDQVGRTLSPRFDPNEAVRRHAATLAKQKMKQSLTAGNLIANVLEMREFLQHLPSRVNRILDRVADNQIEVKVDAIDEMRLIEGLQKIANRITTGLVLAALIVAASILSRVETSFRILGYPGVALLLFFLAASGGLVLLIQIARSDRGAPPRT